MLWLRMYRQALKRERDKNPPEERLDSFSKRKECFCIRSGINLSNYLFELALEREG